MLVLRLVHVPLDTIVVISTVAEAVGDIMPKLRVPNHEFIVFWIF